MKSLYRIFTFIDSFLRVTSLDGRGHQFQYQWTEDKTNALRPLLLDINYRYQSHIAQPSLIPVLIPSYMEKLTSASKKVFS
jgi:hypothetical protein